MIFPKEIRHTVVALQWMDAEAIVRDCVKVCNDAVAEIVAIPSWQSNEYLRGAAHEAASRANAILARYKLESEA